MTDKDTTPILWHNPDADNPLSREIWHGTQIFPDKGLTGLRRNEGKSVGEILGLRPTSLVDIPMVNN